MVVGWGGRRSAADGWKLRGVVVDGVVKEGGGRVQTAGISHVTRATIGWASPRTSLPSLLHRVSPLELILCFHVAGDSCFSLVLRFHSGTRNKKGSGCEKSASATYFLVNAHFHTGGWNERASHDLLQPRM